MDKLYLIAMLIIGYGLGVWSSSFLHKYCYKLFTDEVHSQYKEIIEKKQYTPNFSDEDFDGRGVA